MSAALLRIITGVKRGTLERWRGGRSLWPPMNRSSRSDILELKLSGILGKEFAGREVDLRCIGGG